MSSSRSPEELLRLADAHHEQYLRALRALHEALAPATPSGSKRSEVAASREPPAYPTSPLLRPMSSAPAESTFAPARRPRGQSDAAERRAAMSERKHVPASLNETEYGSDEERMWISVLPLTEAPRAAAEVPADVTEPLATEAFEDEELVAHLRSLRFEAVIEHLRETKFVSAAAAIEEVVKSWEALSSFDGLLEAMGNEVARYGNSTCQVYDIGRNTEAVQRHEGDGDVENALQVWDVVKNSNVDGRSVGRIIILQDPSPIMLGAVHKALGSHFDMDELLLHFLSDKHNNGKTAAFMSRAFEKDPVRQRSFFFVFKYYTVVGHDPDSRPAPWQQYDARPSDKKSIHHIDIAECGSVLALSLSGPAWFRPRLRGRRARAAGRDVGVVYSTFAPWHMLHLRGFPDDEPEPAGPRPDAGAAAPPKRFRSGPGAFLDRLAGEYRAATRRNEELNARIARLITPPTRFMFDVRLRDRLLFEDPRFTYSRRYFWAFNTLGVVNDGIRAMVAAYREAFGGGSAVGADDFWEGRHPHLWRHPSPDSDEGRAHAAEMAGLRAELERAVEELNAVRLKNEATRKEIVSLREQLFSGSSIMESRRAIEQGEYIKILTSISIIFLPLTFVTSVFGMTQIAWSPTSWQFPVMMVCICIPFVLLVAVLQTDAGMRIYKSVKDWCGRLLHRCLFGWAAHPPSGALATTAPSPAQAAAGGRQRVGTAGLEGQRSAGKRRFVRRARERQRGVAPKLEPFPEITEDLKMASVARWAWWRKSDKEDPSGTINGSSV